MKIKDLVENYADLEVPKEILKELGIEVYKDRQTRCGKSEKYFYIDFGVGVLWTNDNNSKSDKNLFEIGNYYPAKNYTYDEVEEIANQKHQYEKARHKIIKTIERVNNGWKPNWGTMGGSKYCIYYPHLDGTAKIDDFIRIQHHENCFYIKSLKLARQVLSECEQEYKIMWGVDND